MGWTAPLSVFITATFVVTGCGGEAIGRTSNGHGPPTNAGRDAGSDAGSDSGVLPPDPADYLRPRSGSRLTVIEPYSPEHPTLWDREKNIECTPSLATDGTMRCLPSSGYSVRFSDPLCQHAVVNPDADPCGGTFKYFVDGAGGGQCTTGMTTVYTAGSPIDTPQALYPHDAYPCSLRDRTVQPSGPTTPDGRFNYYEAVPSDPAEWAAFTEEAVPVTSALAVTVWVGADGSRLPHGLKLLPSKTPCSEYPPSIEPRAPRSWCIPTVRARPGDGFPTDQCTGEHLAGACAPTDVIELSTTGQELDLLETGGLVSTIYFQNPNEGGKCMTFPPAWTSAPNTSVFYRTGSPLDYERYPTLAVSRQGTGRIQVQYLTSGGTNLFVQSYFDTKYGERCTPTELSSGGTWCVPATAVFRPGLDYNVYKDPECTTPLSFADPLQQDLHGLGLVYPPGHACSSWGQPTLYTVAEYRGQRFESSEGRCQPSQYPSPPGVLMLAPDAPIDPSSVLGAVLQ